MYNSFVHARTNKIQRLLSLGFLLPNASFRRSLCSAGYLKNDNTNKANFNNVEKISGKYLWLKFVWVIKRRYTQPTFIAKTWNVIQNSSVLSYFLTKLSLERLKVNWSFGFSYIIQNIATVKQKSIKSFFLFSLFNIQLFEKKK